ncbi:MAG: nucleotidyltransferase domain-containing protein [Methanosarcinales archaeon]|nr:nucleotidyltransferase domain-containing protein [Methanosarcinales archaeon]
MPQYKRHPEHAKEIDKIIEPLKKNRDVISIYLFGSYARGREKPFSDIDICVIADKHANRDEILSHSSKKIDISIFHDLPLSMRFRVLKEGKLLFLRDDLKLHRIIVATIKSYLDFKPHIMRRTERVLGVRNV